MISTQPAKLPHGYRPNASGLIVPEAVSREREVWTKDEWRLIQRATKFLRTKGVQVFFRCEQPACQGKPMNRTRQADGAIVMQCDHKDRVLTEAF